jgi:NAD(P)H dehydrogenase (quinone)
MRILIVLGHPDPRSLNHAIAQAVREDLRAAGHDVVFHDLYAERFDPILDALEIPEHGAIPPPIRAHADDLRSADGIVIVHPNWWGQPPAIMKGWIDRVFRPGVAYRFAEGDSGEGIPIGLLRARAAVVLNTSNTAATREHTAFGDPLDALWRRCIFDLCGVPAFSRRMFSVVVTSTQEQRQAWIAEATALCRTAFQQDSPPPAPAAPPAARTAWETFFDAHAPDYEHNLFTQNTLREVDFILEELRLPPGGTILDIGCGTGRHAIELAQRGYAVTGLDLSAEMLRRAAAAARAANVQVHWIRADATRFSLPQAYDAALCLCEGAFGLLGQGDDPIEQPLAILRHLARSLKPQAKALFTVLNGTAMLRRQQNADVAAGRFDPLGLVTSGAYPPRQGLPPVTVRERAFLPTELVLLFRLAGLTVLHLWGGTAGNWGRRSLDLDEMEIMVVAARTARVPNTEGTEDTER